MVTSIPARRSRGTVAALGTLVLAAASALPLSAQEPEAVTGPPRWWLELHFLAAEPLGTFGELVDNAWGFQFGGRWAPTPGGPLSVRLDLGIMRYGDESRDICLPAPIGCRLGVVLNTNNEIYTLAIGPELVTWGGRLYAFTTFGSSVFATSSSLGGVEDPYQLLTTTHHEKAVFAVRGGVGGRIPLRGGPNPIHLDLGMDYYRNGVAEYLLEGDIVDNPDGTITIHPNRSDANVLAFRLGFTFGFGTARGSAEAGTS